MVLDPVQRTRPAILLAAALLLVSGAAATAFTIPAAADHGEPEPRASAANATATLTVVVTETDGHNGSQRAEDAHVRVYRLVEDDDGRHAEPAARGQTGPNGTIAFELEPDRYVVGAYKDRAWDHERLQLRGDERVHLHLDGRAHDRHQHDEDDRDRPETGSRDRGYAVLTVHVTERSEDGEVQPVAGAEVTIYEMERTRDGRQVERVAQNTTDEEGRAEFHLERGDYGVRAAHGNASDHAKVRLDEDERVHLHLTGGQERRVHPSMPSHAMGVRAFTLDDDGRQPAEDAEIVVQRRIRDAADDGAWRQVAEGTTDEEGLWSTTLPRGLYRVTVTDGDHEIRRHTYLHQDDWVRAPLVIPSHAQPATVSGPAPS